MTDEQARGRLDAEHDRLVEAEEGLVAGGFVGQGGAEAREELSSVDQGPADTGIETFTLEMDQSLLEQVRADLDDVDAALARLEDGTYGLCEACGEAIGGERLEAMPAARFCLGHQQAAERGGRGAGQIGLL